MRRVCFLFQAPNRNFATFELCWDVPTEWDYAEVYNDAVDELYKYIKRGFGPDADVPLAELNKYKIEPLPVFGD